MSILARRFTILCLAMAVFAAGLAVVVQRVERRSPHKLIGFSALCIQPAALHCRATL
jgi:hypothetical protein